MAVGYLPTNFRLQGKNNCLSWAFSTFTFFQGSFQFPFTPSTHKHTYTHAHTQTQNITYTHRHTCYTHTNTQRDTCIHVLTQTCAHTLALTCMCQSWASQPLPDALPPLRVLGGQSLILRLWRYFGFSGKVLHVHHTFSFDKLTLASASKLSSLRIST